MVSTIRFHKLTQVHNCECSGRINKFRYTTTISHCCSQSNVVASKGKTIDFALFHTISAFSYNYADFLRQFWYTFKLFNVQRAAHRALVFDSHCWCLETMAHDQVAYTNRSFVYRNGWAWTESCHLLFLINCLSRQVFDAALRQKKNIHQFCDENSMKFQVNLGERGWGWWGAELKL